MLGVNCVSPRFLENALRILGSASSLPVILYGNVGSPGAERTGMIERDIDEVEYSRYAAQWLAAGVAAIGGCCGTTPAYIAAVSRIARGAGGNAGLR
jgi:S-methylmethionine-dependent homocysteine/selenocysteine methylase